jgi:transcription initiation factor TFIIH subunit 2
MLDYEGELTVIVGRDAKNVTESDALSYVLGYTNGNDVSARNFQLPNASGGQFCYAKSFDGFAPIGPAVVFPPSVANPQDLKLFTRVNGQARQEMSTDDMIWTVAKIIEHLSKGTTLRKGTVIMTGTPSGVGCFMSPPAFVREGDVVEVGIQGLGNLANGFSFE